MQKEKRIFGNTSYTLILFEFDAQKIKFIGIISFSLSLPFPILLPYLFCKLIPSLAFVEQKFW